MGGFINRIQAISVIGGARYCVFIDKKNALNTKKIHALNTLKMHPLLKGDLMRPNRVSGHLELLTKYFVISTRSIIQLMLLWN
jgi:hypothetical protein